MAQRIHPEITFKDITKTYHFPTHEYTFVDAVPQEEKSFFISVYPYLFELQMETLMEDYFIQTHLEDFQEFMKRATPIYPLLVLANKMPKWISLDLEPLLNSEIQQVAKRSLLIYWILTKFAKDPSIIQHTKIEITAGRPSEDIEEDYLTLVINVDGTPQSIEAYKKILSEFYKYPEKLKNIMIFFKVAPQE
ncbi:hypothetical protein E3E35_07945 [Thermococcus sp. GR7]|uniref:hypothetical protein n=1 Tax=unclassified Thermococcus TaxID=2627626 RepID=UPI001432003A|nr:MULTISPECIES: hypothetical protein [unclassified Thermococcus]NJE47330.1 hypothetical protein [Thermococcus sp. GR7]NJE79441.1 hypothetical protein [Thermococcus sp. GR4]NJF23180.1 hypothetical protein [Thermococcus sp. GR5]